MNLIATIKEIREYNDPYIFDKEFSTDEELEKYIEEKRKDFNSSYILLSVKNN